MGFGAFGNGGPSSSNLSALAPPFTVGRTVSNPNSNPHENFINEPPPPYGGTTYNSSLHSWFPSNPPLMPDYYAGFNSKVDSPPPYGGTTYNSPLHSWFPSNPPLMPDYYARFNSKVDSMPLPSVNSLVPQTINSPGSHMLPLTTGANGATDAFSCAQSADIIKNAVDEANQHYPSYVSPAIKENNPLVVLGDSTFDFLSACCLAPTDGTSQDDYTKSLPGWESSIRWDASWNGLRDLESGKCADSGLGFCPNETNVACPPICQDYMNPGSNLFKGLSTSATTCGVSHSIDVLGRENHTGSFSYQSDSKSFIPQGFEFVQFKSSTSGASELGSVSTSVSPGTHHQATSLESITNSWRPHDTCLDNFISATKSSPALVVRPPAVGACASQLNMISFENWDFNGIDIAGHNEDFSRKRLSSVNYPHLTLSSEGNEVCTNPSRFSLYLETNGQDVADTSLRGPLSSNKSIAEDPFNHFSRATELHVPQTNSPDSFPLVLDETKASDSGENSSKSSDPYNPAEDSPCWKGASSSHFSPFEEAVAPQHLVKGSESCGGSSLHGPQILPSLSNDAVRDISEKLRENFHYNQNMSMENSLSPSVDWPSMATYSFGEHRLNSAKAGSFIPEQSCDWVPYSNTVEASKNEPALSNNKTIDPDHRPSNPTKPFLQEVSFTSEKCVSGTCFAENEMNPSDASENGQSHVPIHTMADVLSSVCGENALSKLTKLHGEESTPKLDVPLLVKTMHNLSYLLLFYCSNHGCAVKEQDLVSLKHVINNLNACMLKSPELALRKTSVFSPQGISNFIGGSPDLHQGANVDRVHVTEIAAANAMDELDHQRFHEEKRHNIPPGRKYEKFWNLFPVHNDVDIVKTDEMVQSLKTVFIENFHGEEETHPQVLLYKNLWLEAEAVICSTNFRARFDRMKNEMEKCKPREVKEVSKNMVGVENLSNSKVYPNVITVNKLVSDTQSGIQDSPIISTTGHADDVIARFRMLKCQSDNSPSMNTADAGKVSSTNVFPHLKEVDKLAPQASGLASEIYVEGCPISSKTSHADDVEDSVMARFCVLKCCVDNSSSVDMGEQQLPGVVDLGFVGKKEHSPDTRDGSEDGSFNMTMGHDLLHAIDDCTEDKPTINESGLCWNDTGIQSCGTEKLRDQHCPGWYDGSSLDWEHVLKDDFAWQN